MRSLLKKLALLPFVVVISFSFIETISSQNKPKILIRPDKPSNYEYLVGREIGLSLKGDSCSVLAGNIQEVDGSKVIFSIKERLINKKMDTDTLVITETESRPIEHYLDKYSPKLTVDFRKDNELIVFHCGTQNQPKEYSFITSDKNLFPGIRKVVAHYNQYKQNPEILLDVPNLVRNSNDLIFLGYIVEFLSTGGALEHSDYTVLVLTQLMENDKIPEDGMGFTSLKLKSLIAGDWLLPITPATRDAALKKLIKLGSSDKKLAGQAIKILARIVNKDTIDLRPYLINKQNRMQLYENLQTIPTRGFSPREREKFERLLLGK